MKIREGEYGGKYLAFNNGFKIGFRWTGHDGYTSKTRANIITFHHPESLTWRYVISWGVPRKMFFLPKFGWIRGKQDGGGYWISLPFIGQLSFDYQENMWRKND